MYYNDNGKKVNAESFRENFSYTMSAVDPNDKKNYWMWWLLGGLIVIVVVLIIVWIIKKKQKKSSFY